MPGTPTFNEIVRRPQMSLLLPVVWDAFEVATRETRGWFASLAPSPGNEESEGRPIEPFQAASQIRYLARLYLCDRAWEATNEEQSFNDPPPVYEREDIPNNGLSLFVDDLHVRIFKADHRGQLPPPASDRRWEFYNQQFAGRLFGPRNRPALPAHNVVILWHVRDDSYAFDYLTVAYPLFAERNRDLVEVAWHERYEHPLVSAASDILAPDTGDIPLEAIESDLDDVGESSDE